MAEQVRKIKELGNEKITGMQVVYLECLAMPNGELLCNGNTVSLTGGFKECDQCNNGDIENCQNMCIAKNGSIQCDGDAMIPFETKFALEHVRKYLFREDK